MDKISCLPPMNLFGHLAKKSSERTRIKTLASVHEVVPMMQKLFERILRNLHLGSNFENVNDRYFDVFRESFVDLQIPLIESYS